MTRTQIAVALAAAVTASAFTGVANAQAVVATASVAPAPAVSDEANRPGFSVAGLLGFEVLGNGFGAAFGFGARAGYTLPMHLYVGGDLGYTVGPVGFFHLQGEVGYELGVASVPALLIRPYAGVGFAYASVGGGGGCQTIAGTTVCVNGGGGGGAAAFLFSPGTVVAYDVTPNFFVGGDVRIPILAGSGVTTVGFGILGTGGYKF
jgi:hypothetical protein